MMKTRENEQRIHLIKELNATNLEKKFKLQGLLIEHEDRISGLVSINDGLDLSKQQMRRTYVDLIKRQCQLILDLKEIYPIEVGWYQV
jgi:uncharacterized protein YfbU (UPF0304 family)